MFANTNKQNLVDHSFAIAILARKIFTDFVNKDAYQELKERLNINRDDLYNIDILSNTLCNAAFFHDFGKVDKNFQNFIQKKVSKNEWLEPDNVQIEEDKKFSFSVSPRHQEISWAILSSLKVASPFKSFHLNLCSYAIYWHHAKLLRTISKKDPVSFSKAHDVLNNKTIDIDQIYSELSNFTNSIKGKIKDYGIDIPLIICSDESQEDVLYNSKKSIIPLFQDPEFIETNEDKRHTLLLQSTLFHLFRSILVTADRIVSQLTNEELIELIETKNIEVLHLKLPINGNNENLTMGINNLLENFNITGNAERNKNQTTVVTELASRKAPSVLFGPAGVGKTKIFLEWILSQDKKKVFIIAPKSAICISLYEEIRKSYLPQNTIELITGDRKERSQNGHVSEVTQEHLFKSDIVIMTIDQLLMLMMGHSKIDAFLEVLNSIVICDEFHEFMETPALLILFNQFINLKRMMSDSSTLLVSATPNPFLIHNVLGLEKGCVKKISGFNNTDYKLNFIQFEDSTQFYTPTNDMFMPQKEGTILMFNTASKAQNSAIQAIDDSERSTLVFHSKFPKKEKDDIFNEIRKEFGSKDPTRKYVVRSGPILQASVDISTSSMHTELSTIDNFCQRLGRVVRWGEFPEGTYNVYYPINIESKTGTIAKPAIRGHSYHTVKAFYAYIMANLKDKQNIKLNRVYDMYFNFFDNGDNIEAYKKDFVEIMIEAKKLFSQNFEPLEYPKPKAKKKDNSSITLSKKSLRGNSVFISALNLKNDVVQSISYKDIQSNIMSIERSNHILVGSGGMASNVLEENRNQLLKNASKREYLKDMLDSIKKKSHVATINFKKFNPERFKDIARESDTPILLSFQDELSTMDTEDQYFNISYQGTNLGLMKLSNYKKSRNNQ